MTDVNSKIRRQAPLAKYAFTFAFGIALSRYFEIGANILSALLVLAGALVFHFIIANKNLRLPMMLLAFISGAIISIPPQNPYPDFTSQEAELEIFAERAGRNEKGASYGIGKVLSASKNFEKAKGSKIWFYAKDAKDIWQGDKIRGSFIVRKVEKEEGFNNYLLNQNIFFNAYSAEKTEIESAKFPYSLYKSAREYIAEKLGTFYGGANAENEGARAFRAMILGDKSYLSKDAKNDFKLTGTMHIFAVSGLHVGMLASIIYFILNLLRVPKKAAPAISLPILFLYVSVCQSAPSAMRAFIMISAVWISSAFLRKPKTFASLVAAFFISLAFNPSNLFDAGFALSYSVVLAIVLYAVELDEALSQKIQNLRGFELKNPPLPRRIYLKCERGIIAGLCIGIAAMFASAPLCSCYFGYVPLLSAFLSIPFVLGATAAVACGAASVVLPNFLCPITNSIAAFILEIMLNSAKIFSDLAVVLNVKISPVAAFACEWAILASLFLYPEIKSPAKWILPPAITAATLLSAAIF